jgi:hypothetical protein
MPDVQLIHCSYHKCLTVYYGRVLGTLFNKCLPFGRGHRHYNSHLEDFYAGFEQDRVSSVNNRALDLERLGEFRISRFVRDPRDLVVSGYFYHLRGAEAWVNLDNPTVEDWYFANGCVPAGLSERGGSFAQYLQELSKEEGLLAELEFRRHHFASMAEWPAEHPQILTFRYEEIVGDEERVFAELFDFYQFSAVERALGMWLARRYRLKKRTLSDQHVRNPKPGQWREHFTPRLERAFRDQHGDLAEQLGYSLD